MSGGAGPGLACVLTPEAIRATSKRLRAEIRPGRWWFPAGLLAIPALAAAGNRPGAGQMAPVGLIALLAIAAFTSWRLHPKGFAQ